jgi:1-aminocyclopropane-1-carboxylate deaminase/D-cysteine desulfhydrase-like pyridoxal-dependent ACC family enzyme
MAPSPLDRLGAIPRVVLGAYPTPLEEMHRLRTAIGAGPRLLVKRDDAIPFGFGGNKVRKLQFVIADALARKADTIITCGGVQSNHARATAAAAARHGLSVLLVANGIPPDRPTGNALLNRLLGAEIHYVATRDDRAPAMEEHAARLRRDGRRPYIIPLGASTPLGGLGYVEAVGELLGQGPAPDVIVLATSSGGTLAGLLAGCALHQVPARVIGISADDPASAITAAVRSTIHGIGELLGTDGSALVERCLIEVDDGLVGEGYGIPTPASTEAQTMAARTEALFVDQIYTAKALGGLLGRIRSGELRAADSVLFWHTGGQVGLFA